MKKAIFYQYGFESWCEFFDYILATYKNGQFLQLRKLFRELRKAGQFTEWLDYYQATYDKEDYKDIFRYC